MSGAGKLVPALRGQKNTRPETVWRWAIHGHKLPDGTIIKLESAKLAGRWLTSKPALRRFLERVTSASIRDGTSQNLVSKPKTLHSQNSNTACERANARLAAAGA